MRQIFIAIRQKLPMIGILLLLCFLLKYPAEALNASRDGLNLWLNTLLPTLLPFLILTGFLVHTDGIEKILAPFSGLFRVLLGLSPNGAYVCLLGLLCGYPMGAKLAADLYQFGKISRQEAEYLLTFCSNPSPAFLTTYLAEICLEGRVSTARLMGLLVLSDLLCMLFFRFAVYKNHTVSSSDIKDSRLFAPGIRVSKKETSSVSSAGAVIDASIMNGFETMARLGGYILLFSILSACISHFWCFSQAGKYLVLGVMEITTGLHQLAASGFSYDLRFLCAMTMTSFGGLCIMAQTKSVLEGNLSLRPYASAKCLNAALTAVLILVIS